MSEVTAEILPGVQPPAIEQPRVVRAPWSTEYRINRGTIEARVSGSETWHASGIFELPASTLAADEAAILAELKANPTVTPPAGEDTVVVRMPRSVAVAVMNDLGGTESPAVDPAYEVYGKLVNLLASETL